QMDDAGIELTVVKLLSDLNVTEAKDMGKVMAALKSDYAGQLDMGKASAMVKKKLAG
ncbi:MAG: yqey-like family protein, partial [Micavibrio sp.]|nr:yqey-like family protein [Micavibrio sp.]